ncbi:MAG: hypothetical protein IPL90_19585 [Holophagales bacterium]|nr:hypothetical protein [Holophagales bacterium]
MLKRSVLSIFFLASLLAPAYPAATSERPAVLAVTVVGVQSGVTVMAYWLEKPLFEREVPEAHSGDTPFVFTADAVPGKGHLKVWSFHKARGGGGAAVFKSATLKPGTPYKVAVSPTDGYKLRFDITEN